MYYIVWIIFKNFNYYESFLLFFLILNHKVSFPFSIPIHSLFPFFFLSLFNSFFLSFSLLITWCTLQTVTGVGIPDSIRHGSCRTRCGGSWPCLTVVPCQTHISWGVGAGTAGIAIISCITISLWGGQSWLHTILSRVTVHWVVCSSGTVSTWPALPTCVIGQWTGTVWEIGLIRCGGGLGHVGTTCAVPPSCTFTRGGT